MTAASAPALSRRGFLAGASAAAAAGLTLGFVLPGRAGAAGAAAASPTGTAVNAWLRLTPDGLVTVLCNVAELGQGTTTGIPQIVAEELEVDWSRVRVEMAPLTPLHINPRMQEQATYGSMGIYTQFDALRKAGAAARMMLVEAAARRWGVAAADCTAASGLVRHAASGRTLPYGDLAAEAAALEAPKDPALKPRDRWTLIGKPIPRLDVPAKVDGSAVFGADVKLDGLLSAAIVQCPWHGGRLVGVDEAPALAVRGVRKVVRLDDAVAVVADGWWAAKKGVEALSPTWEAVDNPRLDSAAISARLRDAAMKGGATFPLRNQDPAKLEADTDAAMAAAARRHDAVYEVPFQEHATMEPMNGTARVTAQGVDLWVPTQHQSACRDEVAKVLGVAPETVTVHTTLSGCGFGRRIEIDYALQAARIAKEMDGRPVKLIWSREETTRHGYYRPAAAVRVQAGVDAAGNPTAVRIDTACPSLMDYSVLGRPNPARPPMPVEFTGIMYSIRPGYRGPLWNARYAKTNVGIRCGFWRSVGASQNAFAIESFLDELAVQAGADPMDYRRPLLAQSPRDMGVLEAVAAEMGWSKASPKGVHRGFAMSNTNGSAVALGLEVEVTGKRLRLRRVVAALDCGTVVNPDAVRAQAEGCIVYGLTSAIHGTMTVKDGQIEQGNFDTYPLLTLAETPPMTVILKETDGAMGGAGEEIVPTVAPALTNALFRATGERIRKLPLADAGWSVAT